jgi:hypothetical protein
MAEQKREMRKQQEEIIKREKELRERQEVMAKQGMQGSVEHSVLAQLTKQQEMQNQMMQMMMEMYAKANLQDNSPSEDSTQPTKQSRTKAHKNSFVRKPFIPRSVIKVDDIEYQTKDVAWGEHEKAYQLCDDGVLKQVEVIALQDENQQLYEVIDGDEEHTLHLYHQELYEKVQEASELLISPKDNDAGAKLKVTLFKIQLFMKLAEQLKLEGSTPSHTRQFYDRICMYVKASHSQSLEVMPPFETLSTEVSIKNQILDGVSEFYRKDATSFVNVLSDCIKSILNDPKVVSAHRSPNFYMHVKTWGNREGLDILWNSIKMVLPSLGALFTDMSEIVAHIEVKDGDSLFSFITRVAEVEQNVFDAGIGTEVNAVLKKALNELRKHPSVMPYLAELVCNFSAFQRKNPKQIYRPDETATTMILETLENNGADLQQRLTKPSRSGGGIMSKQSFSNRSEPFTIKRSDKRVGFHKPLVNAMGAEFNDEVDGTNEGKIDSDYL